jgi:hypothetical protein
MGNLSAYKVQGIREAIEAAGASLLYRPEFEPASFTTAHRFTCRDAAR